ncbi:hypothetical protein IWW48_004266 [Coemansia sp. RSA 1200]|nr:hypothetical protein IWW48_004266 [Coemansia sp. RSA 1200]
MTDEVTEKAKHLQDIEHQDKRTALELRKQQKEINDKRYIEETKRLSTQQEKQLALCAAELQAQCYRKFKLRNGAQIDRESTSSMTPEQRRRIMKRPKYAVSLSPNPRADENDGIPRWPRTTKDRETEMRHCHLATNRALFNQPVGRV